MYVCSIATTITRPTPKPTTATTPMPTTTTIRTTTLTTPTLTTTNTDTTLVAKTTESQSSKAAGRTTAQPGDIFTCSRDNNQTLNLFIPSLGYI